MRAFVSPLVEIDNSNNSSALIAQLIALYCSRIAVICLEASRGGRPTFVCIRKTTIVIDLESVPNCSLTDVCARDDMAEIATRSRLKTRPG